MFPHYFFVQSALTSLTLYLPVSLSKNINPSLALIQPRKTRPYITKRLLMGRKESNQIKNKTYQCRLLMTLEISLGPNQAGQNVPTDMDPNCFTLGSLLLKKLILKKRNQQTTKIIQNRHI